MKRGSLYANTSGNLSRYIGETRKFPMLSAEEERALCLRWRDHHDTSAAHRLASSHLRLVTKIALGYRGYGLPPDDLIGEGHLGLMRAVCRFDPDRGVRFATYAICCIRTAIQEYVLHNWSLVKMGTTAAQKKLFFNLHRVRSHTQEFDDRTLQSESVDRIANNLCVPGYEVISMSQRMAGRDFSLNAPVGADGQGEWLTWLVDDTDDQETLLAKREETMHRTSALPSALQALTTRERHIVVERRLRDCPTTLEDLSQHYGISREQIRQIELRAMTKLQRSVHAAVA
jgi:RNA polymerase sigma-32 factor